MTRLFNEEIERELKEEKKRNLLRRIRNIALTIPLTISFAFWSFFAYGTIKTGKIPEYKINKQIYSIERTIDHTKKVENKKLVEINEKKLYDELRSIFANDEKKKAEIEKNKKILFYGSPSEIKNLLDNLKYESVEKDEIRKACGFGVSGVSAGGAVLFLLLLKRYKKNENEDDENEDEKEKKGELTRIIDRISKDSKAINLGEIIENYKKKGKETSQDYSIKFFTQGNNNGIRGCIDSKVGIALFYDGRNVAKISFEENRDKIFVKQIQGVSGEKVLENIKWSKLLLNLIIYLAKLTYGNKKKKIVVQAAKNNFWSHVRSGPRYKLVYDITAKRCGLKKEDEKENKWAYLNELLK